MGRKYIDCRLFPSEMNCTVAISADSEKELIEAAVQHAVAIHKHHDTPEFRAQIKQAIQDLYKVRVVSVNTVTRHGRNRRLKYGLVKGKTSKKAIVRLHPEDTIELV